MTDDEYDAPISIRTGDLVAVAHADLMAAIVLRDILGAAPAQVLGSFPPDILARIMRTDYQDSFNRLPDHIQAEARRLALGDPLIQAARELDANAR